MKWYRASDLDVPRLRVIWRVQAGIERTGTARFTGAGKLIAVLFSPAGAVELRGDQVPAYWRPEEPRDWPCGLPRAVDPEAFGVVDGMETAADADAVPSDWPHPDVELGRGAEPPQCVRETEARILRCIRTARALERSEAPSSASCWPPSLMRKAQDVQTLIKRSLTGTGERPLDPSILDDPEERRLVRRLRAQDLDDFWIDHTLPTVRTRWHPTPRDVSDYNWRPNPLSWIPGTWEAVFAWHAAMPPRGWREIAWMLNTPAENVMEDYAKALETAMKIAHRQRGAE